MQFTKDILSRYAIPALYVTHDLEDSGLLSERVLCLEKGRIAHKENTHERFSLFRVALAHSNKTYTIVEGKVIDYNAYTQIAKISVFEKYFFIPSTPLEKNTVITAKVFARDILLFLKEVFETSHAHSILVCIEKIVVRDKCCGENVVQLKARHTNLFAHITQEGLFRLNLKIGMKIYAQIKTLSM